MLEKFIKRVIIGALVIGVAILISIYISFTDKLITSESIYTDILKLQLVFINMYVVGWIYEKAVKFYKNVENPKTTI